MEYSFHRLVAGSVPEVAERVREALKTEGFGVLTEIDIAGTLKAKTGAEMNPYRILGACHPPSAQRAIEAEPRIGVMLPCNVIVREASEGHVEIAAINPAIPMASIGNPRLTDVAQDVGARLARAVEAV